VYSYEDESFAEVMGDYVGASRPTPLQRDRYTVVREERPLVLKDADAKGHWFAALRAVGAPVDHSTTFARASAIYVGASRLYRDAFVDFGVHAYAAAAADDDDDGRRSASRFASRFTAKIDSIVVVRIGDTHKPITLLDTIVLRTSPALLDRNILFDTDQHFVMCFNAEHALPCEVFIFVFSCCILFFTFFFFCVFQIVGELGHCAETAKHPGIL
jgi:hypothetical protein